MHKTLKRGAIRPPRANLATQQRAFNRFRQEYNDERPHQFLKGRTPGALYRPSPRAYTGTLPVLEYPGSRLHSILPRLVWSERWLERARRPRALRRSAMPEARA